MVPPTATLERPTIPVETGTIAPPKPPQPGPAPKPAAIPEPQVFKPSAVICAMAQHLGMRAPVNEDEARQIADYYQRYALRCDCTGGRAEFLARAEQMRPTPRVSMLRRLLSRPGSV